MKTYRLIPAALIASCLGVLGQPLAAVPSPGSEIPTAVQADPHSTVWQVIESDEEGLPCVRSWRQIATGLNWMNPATGIYEPSVEAFELTRTGHAIAVRGQHKVILAPNINEGAALISSCPTAKRFDQTRWV